VQQVIARNEVAVTGDIFQGRLGPREFFKRPWLYVQNISDHTICYSGPGRSVGIATGCGLDGPGIESR
jgi:hypothetical protein